MKVKDLMSSQIICISPDESAAAAARLLSRHNVGVLPVCDADRRVLGIVTDRDIVLRCVAADANPQRTMIRDFMTRRVVSLSPESSIEEASALMGREQIRRLPVCSDGKLVGLLSLGDLAQRDMLEASEALSDICANIIKR